MFSNSDPALVGFGVRLRSDRNGNLVRQFIVQYRTEDGQRRRKLGRWPTLHADSARKKARNWLSDVAEGKDPASDNDTRRKVSKMAFAKAAEQYLELKKPDVRASTFKLVRMYLTSPKYFAEMHSKPVSRIDKSDVSEALDAIKIGSGNVSALQARTHLNTFFAWCVERGHCDQNPCIGAAKFDKGDGRTRVLNAGELAAVWNACNLDTDFGRIVRLLVLTGCRREEIGGLRWSEIDFDEAVINLPGERTKNRKPFTIPLVPAALDILRNVPHLVGGDHLFGDDGFGSWEHHKRRLGDGVEVPWKLHDLRRTFRTGLSGLGIQRHVAELCINHVKKGLDAVYDQKRICTRNQTSLRDVGRQGRIDHRCSA